MSEAMNYGLCLDSGEFIAADELNSQAEQANRPLDVRDARIAELEQRNRDLHEDVQRFKEHALSEKDAQMALERELAEVRKDAARYRWLRDETEWEPFDSAWLNRNDIYGCPAQEMDVAIDAAMKGTP